MTISLPTDPKPNGATPVLRDFGGVLTPFLGGPEQRINRVGTRFGLRVTMPPLESSVDGRLFVARLNQAKTDRLVMEWPLLDFDPGSPGSPAIHRWESDRTAPSKERSSTRTHASATACASRRKHPACMKIIRFTLCATELSSSRRTTLFRTGPRFRVGI